jgi:hypothetical protein
VGLCVGPTGGTITTIDGMISACTVELF